MTKPFRPSKEQVDLLLEMLRHAEREVAPKFEAARAASAAAAAERMAEHTAVHAAYLGRIAQVEALMGTNAPDVTTDAQHLARIAELEADLASAMEVIEGLAKLRGGRA